jgi:hypothetical protein
MNYRAKQQAALRAESLAGLRAIGDAYIAAGEAYDADPSEANAAAAKSAADALHTAQQIHDRRFRPNGRPW